MNDVNFQVAAEAQSAAHALIWLDLPSCQGHPASLFCVRWLTVQLVTLSITDQTMRA